MKQALQLYRKVGACESDNHEINELKERAKKKLAKLSKPKV